MECRIKSLNVWARYVISSLTYDAIEALSMDPAPYCCLPECQDGWITRLDGWISDDWMDRIGGTAGC